MGMACPAVRHPAGGQWPQEALSDQRIVTNMFVVHRKTWPVSVLLDLMMFPREVQGRW